MNTVDHVTSALRSLYSALADVERRRDVLRTSIESLTQEFHPSEPTPVPRKSGDISPSGPSKPRMRSRYPSRTPREMDCDLTGLQIDTTGKTTWRGRVEMVARSAHRSGKYLTIREVSQAVVRAWHLATPYETADHNVQRVFSTQPARYLKVGRGTYEFLPDYDVP